MVMTMISQSHIRIVRVIERTLNGKVNIEIPYYNPNHDTMSYDGIPGHAFRLDPTQPASSRLHSIPSHTCHVIPRPLQIHNSFQN